MRKRGEIFNKISNQQRLCVFNQNIGKINKVKSFNF